MAFKVDPKRGVKGERGFSREGLLEESSYGESKLRCADTKLGSGFKHIGVI